MPTIMSDYHRSNRNLQDYKKQVAAQMATMQAAIDALKARVDFLEGLQRVRNETYNGPIGCPP
jgi:hypothetical protein